MGTLNRPDEIIKGEIGPLFRSCNLALKADAANLDADVQQNEEVIDPLVAEPAVEVEVLDSVGEGEQGDPTDGSPWGACNVPTSGGQATPQRRRPSVPFGSPLYWPGSKGRMARRISPCLPVRSGQFRSPFAGGLGLERRLLSKASPFPAWRSSLEPESVRLNDKDPNVSNFWTVLLQRPRQLAKVLLGTPSPTRDDWFQWKAELLAGTAGDPVESAAKLVAVSRLAHNGLCLMAKGPRTNLLAKWDAVRIAEATLTLHGLLAGLVPGNECTNLDFEAVLTAPGDFWAFLDPPYVGDTEQVYCHSFTELDHRRLARVLRRLDQPWMMTYDATPLVRELYGSWACLLETAALGKPGATGKTGLLVYPHSVEAQVWRQFEQLGLRLAA